MGVRGLLSYISPIQTSVNLSQCIGWKIGVDTMYLLYHFREQTDALHAYVKELVATPLTLSFIMDGKADDEKKECIGKRRDVRQSAAGEVEQLQKKLEDPTLPEEEKQDLTKKLQQKQHDAWYLTPQHKQQFIAFVKEVGCEVIRAPKEADALLASPVYDAVISADTDILVLGCQRLWVPLTTGGHRQYFAEDMWRILGLDTRHQLLELAFLAGCDVQMKPILPFDKALSHLRFYGSLLQIHIAHPEVLPEEMLKRFVWLCRGVWANV